MMGCASCGSLSFPAPPSLVYFILGAEPALNNLSKFWGPPQFSGNLARSFCKRGFAPLRLPFYAIHSETIRAISGKLSPSVLSSLTRALNSNFTLLTERPLCLPDLIAQLAISAQLPLSISNSKFSE